MAIPGIEALGWSQAEAEKDVVEGVQRALRRVLEVAAAEGITTEAAAHCISEERLRSGI